MDSMVVAVVVAVVEDRDKECIGMHKRVSVEETSFMPSLVLLQLVLVLQARERTEMTRPVTLVLAS